MCRLPLLLQLFALADQHQKMGYYPCSCRAVLLNDFPEGAKIVTVDPITAINLAHDMKDHLQYFFLEGGGATSPPDHAKS